MATIAAVTSETFQEQVLESKRPVVVRFWATWCRPCTTIKPIFDEIATELSDQADFSEIDIDQAPTVASALGIRSVPTIVVFKDGQAVGGIVGAAPKSQITTKIAACL